MMDGVKARANAPPNVSEPSADRAFTVGRYEAGVAAGSAAVGVAFDNRYSSQSAR